ncbi:hypothetical protein [Algoriphagus confluentis]|uniref:Lipoprotein n=1 Tax=Algoriphagus confluentis TaxID=1697556 RepID=A0ABQ6PKI4_9BACT|nr:hypothetical protein Aconfl_11020 [Algoriphagus confluentis]
MVGKKEFLNTLGKVFILFAILISGCQSEIEPADCYKIEVIGPDRCGGGLLVSVKNSRTLGESITYYDGNSYPNVIRLFTLVSVPESRIGFVRIRDFDPTEDENFSVICQGLYAPYPVPTKVATFWSEDPC